VSFWQTDLASRLVGFLNLSAKSELSSVENKKEKSDFGRTLTKKTSPPIVTLDTIQTRLPGPEKAPTSYGMAPQEPHRVTFNILYWDNRATKCVPQTSSQIRGIFIKR